MSQIDEPILGVSGGVEPRSVVRRVVDKLKRLGATAPMAVVAAVLPGAGALVLYGHLSSVANWLMDRPMTGPVMCAAGFAVAGGVALVPTYAMSALCGWTFGVPVGLAATLTGFVAAAMVGYFIGQRIDGGKTLAIIGENQQWKAVHAAMTTGGFGKQSLVVTLLRLAPVAPFSLSNLVMAAAQVRPMPYALGTLLGMLPRTAIVVWAASQLNSPDTPLANDPWLIGAGVVVTIFVMIALGWIGKAGLKQFTQTQRNAS